MSLSTLLWVVAAVIAATLLIGSISRRRANLTETLKEYVDENQVQQRAAMNNEQQPNGEDNS